MITGQRINTGHVTADIPVTFFISTGINQMGYGIFHDNTYKMWYDMGKESNEYYYISADGGELLFYFIYGPTFKTILDSYTNLTGRPSMLPKWTLGYIQSKCTFYDWPEVDDVIETMENKKIPFDCMVFDFDWAEYMHNFKWNSRFNGKRPERIASYQAKGINFMVSNFGPMIKKESDLNAGVLAKDLDENTVTCGHYGGQLMDFSNPNMKKWLRPSLNRLIDKGIKGWWLDLTEPEGDPDGTQYFAGDKSKVHNVFSLLNSKTYYELSKEHNPTERPFILTRTGTAGIQKYGTSIWTGDVFSDYDTFSAHCPEALNTTMSGISAWTCDSSGFISSTYNGTDNI
jgi:alpha-glucosidase